jgi:hypothetical protein
MSGSVSFRQRLGLVSPLVWVLVAFAAAWTVLFVAVPPGRQEFPLNDDWAYSRGVFGLARGEGIHYWGLPSMPQLGQWLWALPFVKVFGESHVVLRLAIVLVAMLGVAAFYDLLRREAVLTGPHAAVAALVLAFNPLYFLLAGSFMTDVFALALSLAALGLYARALRSGRLVPLIAGAAAATLACITRQNAVTAPIAMGLVVWWRRPDLRWAPRWVLALLLPIALGFDVDAWFGVRPDQQRVQLKAPTVEGALVLGYVALHAAGLAALPLLTFVRPRASRLAFMVALLVMAEGALYCYDNGGQFTYGGLFPYRGNMLTPWGTFEANAEVPGERPRLLGTEARLALTAAGCLGAAALLACCFARRPGEWFSTPLLPYTLLHLPFLLAWPYLFDRYLLVFVPGTLYLVAGSPEERLRWKPGVVVLALLCCFSVAHMHDWLSWNAARWEVGRRALARGIPSADIEGGFEWDGWHSPYVLRQGFPAESRDMVLPGMRDIFPHITGRCALTFAPPAGTVVLDREPYELWLLPGRRYFWLVERRP